MPERWWERLRAPIVSLVLSLCCLVASWYALGPSLRQVAEATGPGSCGPVPWLGMLRPCRGIILLELARDSSSAQHIVETLRHTGAIGAAVTSVRRDYFLIPSYVAFLGFLGMTAVRLAEVLGFPRVPRIISFIVFLQLAAGILDARENVGLFRMLVTPAFPASVPLWTAWAAALKWWFVLAGLVVPLFALLWMLLRSRRTAGAGMTARLASAGPSR